MRWTNSASDDTIFIFTADNRPEFSRAWVGSSGPWRGTYFTGLEASLRVPFIVRRTGTVRAGAVSNEIVHERSHHPLQSHFELVVTDDRCSNRRDDAVRRRWPVPSNLTRQLRP